MTDALVGPSSGGAAERGEITVTLSKTPEYYNIGYDSAIFSGDSTIINF